MNLVDIAGWIMVVATIGTFCFRNVMHLRMVCIVGCVVSLYYYGMQPQLMIQSLVINIAVMVINVYHVVRMWMQTGEYKSRQWFKRKLRENDIREVILQDGVKVTPKNDDSVN